ncbi:MAG: LCP family protein [Propionibacteriales bacterium]|nr:LCP family protein [Propionibacteriales bacterium]
MADKENPEDRQFDWLYPGRPQEGTPSERDPSTVDPEATQQFRVTDEDNRTQVLGTTPPSNESTDRPLPDQAGDRRPASFGGTYAAPPSSQSSTPRSEQRFAPPSSQQAPPKRPTAPSGPPAPKQPRRGHGRLWVRGIGLLVLAWVVFLVATPIWAYSSISKIDAEPSGDRPDDTPGTTYLLVGSDSREGLDKQQRGDLATGNAEGQRTDSIIVLHVSSGNGPNLLLSIPRDSYVDIPGHDKNKINAAYAFGGSELLVETVEQVTDLRIDNYIEVGFTGFVDVVDAVGGIEVCPTTPINDPKAGRLEMKPGCQQVDGHTALQYSRSRAFGNGDITRALHQREVIAGVGKKAASWKTVVLPWRYFKVNKAAADSLGVGEDVGPFDLIRFAWAMAHSSGKDTKRCVVPFTSLGTQTPAGLAVIWDDAKAAAIFDAIRDDDTDAISCLGQ